MVRAIAREIRAASGGLKGVKAMGVLAHGRAQLSMNITDFEATPISQVYRAVSRLAARHKAAIAEGEVIGLIPEAACERESEWMRQLGGFDEETKILERRLAPRWRGRRRALGSAMRNVNLSKRTDRGKIDHGTAAASNSERSRPHLPAKGRMQLQMGAG